ncbi:MAG: acyl-CoA dehydrogenase, C-terminal [Mycobacterium sp.]|nr:acyl-CoA dehydrogenase, C-terminal [Mycobacterium sp.]
MRFGFTDDQRELAAAVREILSSELTPELRASGSETSGRRGQVWKALADAGVFGLLVPEESGGLGMNELDAVLVLEELGRAAVPGLVAETAFVAAPFVAAEASASQWLEGLAEGAVAVSSAEVSGYLPDADVADLLIVADGNSAQLLPGGAELTKQVTVDPSRPLFSLPTASGVSVSGAGVAALRDRAVVATAAQLVGASAHMLESSVAYAKTRKQFGREIGSFQALKHQLADLMLAVEFARPLVQRAAYSLANGTETASRDASAAKVFAAQAAEHAARTSIQVHGAIGYTDELDLQYWLKRVWWLVPAWGDAIVHRAKVATAIIDTPPLARDEIVRTP